MRKAVETVKQKLVLMLCDCSGPTATEYAVMLGLIVLVAMGAIRAVGVDWDTKIVAELVRAIPGDAAGS